MRVFLVCIAIATQVSFALTQGIQQIGLSNEQRTRTQTQTQKFSSSTSTTKSVSSVQSSQGTRSVGVPFSTLATSAQNAGGLTTSPGTVSESIQALANFNVQRIPTRTESVTVQEITASKPQIASSSNIETMTLTTARAPSILTASEGVLTSPSALGNAQSIFSTNAEVPFNSQPPSVTALNLAGDLASQGTIANSLGSNSDALTSRSSTVVQTTPSIVTTTTRSQVKRPQNLITLGGSKQSISTESSGVVSKQLAKTVKTTSGFSSTTPGSVIPESPIVVPVVITESKEAHTRFKAELERQAAEIKIVKSLIPEQINNWYFKSPELQSEFEGAQTTMVKLLELSQSYTVGSEKLLLALEGSDLQPEWIDQVKKLQNLASIALSRSTSIMEVIRRLSAEILEDHRMYTEAKAQQTAETKATMDNELNELLQQTLQVGQQANKVIMQAKGEWANILRSHLGAAKAGAAIARINDITASIQADLEHLSPEDLETAMNDAHRCIEDIKGLFHSYNIPVLVIRQSVNPVQLATFSIITKGKNIHTQAITNLK